MSRTVAVILLVVVLVVLQVSFLSTWPMPVQSLNLVLTVLMFLAITDQTPRPYWLSLGAGALLELYSTGMFGAVLLAVLGAVVVVRILAANFLTNRSLYAVAALGAAGSVAYSGILVALTLVGSPQTVTNLNLGSVRFLVWQAVLNTLILLLVFWLSQRLSRRLQGADSINHYSAYR